jgi:hypothetical protein
MRKIKVAILAIAAVAAGQIACAQEQRGLIGGPCSYLEIPGECRIVSVAKTSESIRQKETIGGPGYEGNVVKFTFHPLKEKGKSAVTPESETEYTLRLTNSWYPGDRFLEKYKIAEGKVFKCEKRTIIKGTCTPVVFKFPDIDTSDYFETKK